MKPSRIWENDLTLRDLYREGVTMLSASASDSPGLDARLLLCHLLDTSMARLLASWPDIASSLLQANFIDLCSHRAKGRPLAYITGKKEFYGRDFLVDERVLIPRPDTEILVENALAAAQSLHASTTGTVRIIDCCTGSGCIGITLALELKALGVPAKVWCSDLSPAALDASRANAAKLGALDLVEFVHSDLLTAFAGYTEGFHLVCANPPYLTSREVDEGPSLSWGEPRMALDGGDDGMTPYEPLATQAYDLLVSSGSLLLEIGSTQKKGVLQFLRHRGYSEIHCLQDLAGHDRVVTGKKQEYGRTGNPTA